MKKIKIRLVNQKVPVRTNQFHIKTISASFKYNTISAIILPFPIFLLAVRGGGEL